LRSLNLSNHKHFNRKLTSRTEHCQVFLLSGQGQLDFPAEVETKQQKEGKEVCRSPLLSKKSEQMKTIFCGEAKLSQGQPLIEVLAYKPKFPKTRVTSSQRFLSWCGAVLCGYRSYSARAARDRNYGARGRRVDTLTSKTDHRGYN
jgi:hypothetical protein